MKTRVMITVAVLFLMTSLTSPAWAVYHAGLGRFLQRDPGPDVTMRAGGSGMAVGNGFAPRDQYRDGMNLYQYVRSNPTFRRDPFGLISDSGCHCGPDATAWLSVEMVTWYNWVVDANKLISEWASVEAPWYVPNYSLGKMYQYDFLKYVARRMTYYPSTTFKSSNCPTSPQCSNTVTIYGTCIHTSEIGNLMYGSVARWFEMTWFQTWGGGVYGNRGKRTDADAAGVSIGYDYGNAGGYLSVFMGSIDPARLDELGSDASAQCKPCHESVNAYENHVRLSSPNTIPLSVGMPKTVD